MLDVCLLGTGGMMPLPRRALTALMLRYNGSSILVDCGEGTQVAIKEQGWSFKSIDLICITHFHADHVSGLPGLLLTIGNADRREPLVIMGPKRVEAIVNALRIVAPELPFPIEFVEIQGDEDSYKLGDVNICAYKVNHNMLCYGYTFSIDRAGRFDPEKAKNNNVPMKAWSRLQHGEVVELEGNVYTSDMILGSPRKGIKLSYCTDTRPTQSIIQHVDKSDLLICEGMYGEDGKEAKAREYKHMTMYEAAQIALDADVKELWLTHYSPSLVNPEQYAPKVKAIFPNTKVPKTRIDTVLQFED